MMAELQKFDSGSTPRILTALSHNVTLLAKRRSLFRDLFQLLWRTPLSSPEFINAFINLAAHISTLHGAFLLPILRSVVRALIDCQCKSGAAAFAIATIGLSFTPFHCSGHRRYSIAAGAAVRAGAPHQHCAHGIAIPFQHSIGCCAVHWR